MEKVFVNDNPKSTLALGQARGASLTAIALEKIPITELSSNEIKKSIVGNGHATKTQMQFMVKNLLRLNTEVCQDASDALASAITLSHRLKLSIMINRILGIIVEKNPSVVIVDVGG